MPRPEKNIERANQRNQSAAIGGFLTTKYRPLLASSDVSKKRPSDSPTEELRLMTNSETDPPLTNGNKPSIVRPRKQRITDSSDGIMQSKERGTHPMIVSPKSTAFDWSEYLKDLGVPPAPSDYFLHLPQDILKNSGPNAATNLFTLPVGAVRPNQYLEGIDPHNESLFCAFKIAEVVGRRLKLRFVGYPEKYDFWASIDSHFIFPVGWCAHNSRTLQPPKNYLDRDQTAFDWSVFLSEQKASAVPRQFFRIPWDCPSSGTTSHLFRIGSKLEAVDKRNPAVVCVATVKDCLCDYILVHFDGWDRGFDQWVHITSGLLHPVGYCQEKELILSIPSEWNSRPGGFTWRQYLKENDAKIVPKEAFKQPRLVHQLQVGQRMEAVDRRCPQLIRVAQIISFGPAGFITIGYDGWPEKLNVLLEANSMDLLPVGYCQLTGHPLYPPTGYDLECETNGLALDAQSNSSASSFGGFAGSAASGVVNNSCSTPGCKGVGHIKGPRYLTHQRLSGCPYADVNLRKDLIRAHERLPSSNIVSFLANSTSQLAKDSSISADPFKPLTFSAKLPASDSRLSPDLNALPDLLPVSVDSGLFGKPASVISPTISISSTTSSQSATVITTNPSSLAISVHSGGGGVKTFLTGPLVTVSSNVQPLDLSLERSKSNSTPSMDVSSNQGPEFHLPIGSCQRDLLGTTKSHSAFATIQGNDVSSVASFMDLQQTVNLSYSPSVTLSGSTMPKLVGKKGVSSGKRPINASLKTDPSKQDVKQVKQTQRVPPISTTINDYVRQQQMYGVAGMPVKRKRGRPRKYSLHMIPSTSYRSAPLPASATSRSSLPVVIGPHTSGSSVSVPTISGMNNSAVMPTLSLYAPSNVSTPQPGTLYTAGLVIAGSSMNSFTDSNSNINNETVSDPVKSDCCETLVSLSQQTTQLQNVNNQPTTSYSDLATVTTGSDPLVNSILNGYDPTICSGSLNSISQCPSISVQCSQTSVLANTVSSFPYSSVPTGTISTNSSFNFSTTVPNDMYATIHPASYSTFPITSQRFSNPLLPVWGVEPSAVTGGSHISSGYLNFAPTELYPSLSLYTPLNNSPTLKNSAVKFDADLLTRLLPQANAALQAAKLVGLPGPHSWNLDMVANFVATLPGCKQFSKVFIEHEIDGAALLCLEQHDLMRVLGMKLGPAVKVFSAIQTLRRSVLATPISEFSTEQNTAMALATSCFNHTTLTSPIRRHTADESTIIVTNGHVDASPTSSDPTDDSNRQPPCMDRFCPVSSHEFSSVT